MDKSRFFAVMVTLSLAALLTGACTSQPGPTPTTDLEPSPTPTPGIEVTDAAEARDVALTYLRKHDAQNAPSADIVWQEEDVTPPGWVGGVFKEFTSDEWTIKVSYAVLPPESTVYQITVSSIKLGWRWKGSVKADGSLTEVSAFRQMSQEESQRIAEEFLRNSPTFAFDGIEDTLRLTDTLRPRCPYCWVFIYEFDSRHPGYADRTGEILAQVITPHRAVIAVEQLEITFAVMDDKWDMLRREIIDEQGNPVGVRTVAELLANPVYDSLVKIHGEVSLLGELFCPCFMLSSGGKEIQVWYDAMVENDGGERPPANMHKFENGDRVQVIGKLKGEGGIHYYKGDFWASDITYIFPAPPPASE